MNIQISDLIYTFVDAAKEEQRRHEKGKADSSGHFEKGVRNVLALRFVKTPHDGERFSDSKYSLYILYVHAYNWHNWPRAALALELYRMTQK